MNQSFMHPSSIPVTIALAIYAISHNHAIVNDWETMDSYVRLRGLDVVIDQITEVLRMNGVDEEQMDDERAWWTHELLKVHTVH